MNPLLGAEIPLPTHATGGSAALDLRACLEEAVTLLPGETVTIPSGIAIAIHDPGLVPFWRPAPVWGSSTASCWPTASASLTVTTRGRSWWDCTIRGTPPIPCNRGSGSARCCSCRWCRPRCGLLLSSAKRVCAAAAGSDQPESCSMTLFK